MKNTKMEKDKDSLEIRKTGGGKEREDRYISSFDKSLIYSQ